MLTLQNDVISQYNIYYVILTYPFLLCSFLHNAYTQAGYTGTLPSHSYQK